VATNTQTQFDLRAVCCCLCITIGTLGWPDSAAGETATTISTGTLTFDPHTGWASLFDGQSLGHWQPTDFYGKGRVHVQDGAIQLEKGNDMTGVTWDGPLLRQNYEIELEAQRVEGMDFFCGLTVPIGKEHFTLVCGGWGGSLVGISCVDFYDAANNMTCTSHNFENKKWYTIRLRVTDYLIQAWIDDEQLVDFDTAEHSFNVRFEVERSQPLGIATWQTHGAIRALRVRKVKPMPRFKPTYTYTPLEIEGWKILVSETLTEDHPELSENTLRLLRNHLYRIQCVLPAEPLAKLRKVKIWVEYEDVIHRCMCYHPSRGWLTENGYNPDKAGSVELANATNFLAWTHAQPWMVLHELAHAYHHQVLGHDYQPLQTAFAAAQADQAYEEVLHINGQKKRHYALNNEKEYFAEGTEAFFGTNDFYPFVRAELKLHDPDLHRLMAEIWK
jgi:hypothetical protein